MRRRRFLRLSLGGTALSVLGGCGHRTGAPPAELAWRERTLLGFGTTLRLLAGHADVALLEHALDEAVAELRAIEAEMSLYDPESALCRLNRDGRLEDAPPRLLAVLSLARDVSAASGGLFDATVQPLWTCWDRAAREGRIPGAAELASARSRVGWQAVQIDEPRRSVRYRRPGMGVTLNGIAQGHAADRVKQVLRGLGIEDALIDAGEYSMLGLNHEQQPWMLGMADPTRGDEIVHRLRADGRCIATSADDFSAFTADHRHHHILDPRIGDSPPDLSGVTVVADSGALADALTKVMFIAGPARIPALARAWNVDVVWVDKQGRWGATPNV